MYCWLAALARRSSACGRGRGGGGPHRPSAVDRCYDATYMYMYYVYYYVVATS